MLQLEKKRKKKRWKCRKCRRTNATRIQTSSRSLSAYLDSGYCAWTVARNFDISVIFNISVSPVHCSRDPQILLFSNFFIKNGSHDTSNLFKNDFATMFSVFSFQFQQNKFYPNRPESPVQKCGFPRFGAENETSKIFTKHKILGFGFQIMRLAPKSRAK